MSEIQLFKFFLLLSNTIFRFQLFSFKIIFKSIFVLFHCDLICLKFINSPLKLLKMDLQLVLSSDVISYIVFKLPNNILIFCRWFISKCISLRRRRWCWLSKTIVLVFINDEHILLLLFFLNEKLISLLLLKLFHLLQKSFFLLMSSWNLFSEFLDVIILHV